MVELSGPLDAEIRYDVAVSELDPYLTSICVSTKTISPETSPTSGGGFKQICMPGETASQTHPFHLSYTCPRTFRIPHYRCYTLLLRTNPAMGTGGTLMGGKVAGT
jgi:hypothetical protein